MVYTLTLNEEGLSNINFVDFKKNQKESALSVTKPICKQIFLTQ